MHLMEPLPFLDCILLAVENLKSNESLSISKCTIVLVLPNFPISTLFQTKNSVYMTFTEIINSTKEFPDVFFPKHLFPCSILIYDENVKLPKIGKRFTEFVPGIDENNFHIFLINYKIQLENLNSAVKALPHIIFVSFNNSYNGESFLESDVKVSTLDAISKNLVKVWSFNVVKNLIEKCIKYGWNFGEAFQFKRWNFQGLPFRIAMSVHMPGPRQPDFDSRRRNEYPRTFNYSRYFKHLVMIMAHLIEDGVNGSATAALFETPLFGNINPESGEWVGLLREVIDEKAHTCIGLAASQEQGKVVVQANAFSFSAVSFLIALPRQVSGSSAFFIFESFQFAIWLILCGFAGAIILLLSLVNSEEIQINIELVLLAIIDQPCEQLRERHFSRSNILCPLMTGWFVAIIVVGNLFKSRLTSVLVEPDTDSPPDNLIQLAKSDYQIGTLYYKETEFESVVLHMENLTVVQNLKKKFLHYNVTAKDKCLQKVLEGHYVCMGIQSLLSTFARDFLKNKYGQRLYTFSKDILAARFVIPVLSNYVGHCQGRFNFMTSTMLENGLLQHWNSIIYREKANKLRYIEKSGSETYAEAVYPLYILGIGSSISLAAFLFEVCKNRISAKRQENNLLVIGFLDILNSTKEFPDVFYTKHSFPCSIVIYEEKVKLPKIGKSWTEFVPGIDANNLHNNIFLINHKIQFENLNSAVKALPHIFEAFQFKRWDFKGLPFRIAMSVHWPGPRQPDFDSRRRNEHPRTFNYSHYFKHVVMIMAHLIEDGVNGSATAALFQTPLFGRINPETGKWVGLVREVMDEKAHTCIGLAASQEQGKVVVQTNAFGFSAVSFLVALPRQVSGSSAFTIFDSFQFEIWLILCGLAGLIILLLSLVNSEEIQINIELVLLAILDQPCVKFRARYFSRSNILCPLMTGWFVAIIVVGNLFKSRFTSVLVEPDTDSPPQNLIQLVNSDYQIGTLYYRETEFEAVVLQMENLTVVKNLKKKFLHYNVTAKDVCLKKVLQGHNVCMGVQSLLSNFGRDFLKNKYDQNLYTFSKDILAVRFVIPVLSNYVAHVQGRFNFMTSTMLENGLLQHWNSIIYREKANKLRYIEKTSSKTFAEAVYPLYVLGVGSFISRAGFCFEICKYRVSCSKNQKK
ncbi:unnamed protein product [Orchesella dallaii]|uniref:Uncharacterized protein n=1 Tax=Orchesella dallaii TaxID=48710 RepID=A0ABP1S7G3_9HEXA